MFPQCNNSTFFRFCILVKNATVVFANKFALRLFLPLACNDMHSKHRFMAKLKTAACLCPASPLNIFLFEFINCLLHPLSQTMARFFASLFPVRAKSLSTFLACSGAQRFFSVGSTTFVHPKAVLIGNVTLGKNVSIWPGAVLRGGIC